jgi:hypothetical protein
VAAHKPGILEFQPVYNITAKFHKQLTPIFSRSINSKKLFSILFDAN